MSTVDDYKKLNNGFNKWEKISSFTPQPSETDYQNGYVRRFFVQKTNDPIAPIYEISSKLFLRLSNKPEFNVVTLRWRITGSLEPVYDDVGNVLDFGVKESNRRMIELQKNKIPGLKYRITNYLQFYRQQ